MDATARSSRHTIPTAPMQCEFGVDEDPKTLEQHAFSRFRCRATPSASERGGGDRATTNTVSIR